MVKYHACLIVILSFNARTRSIRVVLYYVFSAAVLGYAFVRISRGLESTYETRKSCVVKNLSVLLAYVGYAIALFGLYIGYVVSEDSEADSNAVGDSTGTKTLGYIITLFVGCRYGKYHIFHR